MSTLSVNTVKSLNTSGPVFQNSSGTEKGRLAKAWVNFDGVDVTTDMTGVDASFNISSVTDEGVGLYTIAFTTNTFSNANYCFAGSLNNTQSNGTELAGPNRGPVGVFQSHSGTKTATNIRVETRYGSTVTNPGAVFDFRNVYCVFFGG